MRLRGAGDQAQQSRDKVQRDACIQPSRHTRFILSSTRHSKMRDWSLHGPLRIRQLFVLLLAVLVGAMAAASTCFAFAFAPRDCIVPPRPHGHIALQYQQKTHFMITRQPPSEHSETDKTEKRKAILEAFEARSVQAGSSSKLRQYLYKTNLSTITLKQIQSVMSYLDSVLGSAELTNAVLQSTPRIIRKSVETQLKPTVEFLQSIYSDDLFLKAIERNPRLLVTSGVGYDGSKRNAGGEDVEKYLTTELGLAESAVTRLKRANPTIFQFSVEGQIRPVADYLVLLFAATTGGGELTQVQLAKARKLAGKVVKTCPAVLGLSVASNLMPKLNFLKARCGLDHLALAKIVDTYPELLGLSLSLNIQPTIDYLSNILLDCSAEDLPDDAVEEDFAMWLEDAQEPLRKCISRHPQIFGLSIENLRSKVSYFDKIDSIISVDAALDIMAKEEWKGQKENEQSHNKHVKVQSLAARVLSAAPSTYSLSLENNIIPKTECLAKLWGADISAGADLVLETIRDDENGCRLKSLLPKSNILRSALSEYPPVLTLSIEGNLLPTIDFYNRTGYVHLDQEGRATSFLDDDEENNSDRLGTSVIRARYLATSLFNRLLPRWHYYKTQRPDSSEYTSLVDDPLCSIDTVGNNEANGDATSGGNNCQNEARASRPPLHLLAGASDAQFCAKCNFELESYEQYRQDEAGKLKFNWQFAEWVKTGRPID